jgi:activating signal cointegrator complex subunit 3
MYKIKFQLFDLLGFDRFELIQSLLEKRKQLITATLDVAAGMPSEKTGRKQDGRPQFGCQVTIQVNELKTIFLIFKMLFNE